jgi:hypothetical protein
MPLQPWQRLLPYVTAVAAIAGLLVRFKGLGAAPLSVDEYYLSQSVGNVLRHGLPAFDCGGYYTRGLVLQYLAAASQLAGLSPELGPRLISALSSLLVLPAALVLGRRTHGALVGSLVVVILALSVWEIEMGRFGRMYAPFQALFLWYLVFFVRYTVDGDRRARWPMLALSIVGALVWEGGIFLLLCNLLPPFLQLPAERRVRMQWRYLTGCAGLLAVAYWFIAFDFRGSAHNAFPASYDPLVSEAARDPLAALPTLLAQLPHHAWWLAAAAIPLAMLPRAVRWIRGFRARPLLALSLLGMLVAAAAHQFLLVGSVGLLLLMMRFIDWDEFFGRPARSFHVILLAYALFWLAFGAAMTNWGGAHLGAAARGLAALGYQLLRFPDAVGVVVRPWARAVPHLGAALLMLSAAAMYRMARSREPLNTERALLVLFVVLLLAASASHPPRQETRYVFNLYPIAIVIAVTTIARGAELLARKPVAIAGLTTIATLGGFALSEDFRPGHLLHIDERATTFKAGMPGGMQSHLVIRDDYRALAGWLQRNVPSDALVINGVHGLDHYYHGISYFYVNVRDPNFPQWSCRNGTVERWGNYPLLYSVDELAAVIKAKPAAYLVAFGYDNRQLLQSLAQLQPRIALEQGGIVILELRG